MKFEQKSARSRYLNMTYECLHMYQYTFRFSQGWHEMYCHDLEVMSSNPGCDELGVHSTSVPSRSWNKYITNHENQPSILKFCPIVVLVCFKTIHKDRSWVCRCGVSRIRLTSLSSMVEQGCRTGWKFKGTHIVLSCTVSISHWWPSG